MRSSEEEGGMRCHFLACGGRRRVKYKIKLGRFGWREIPKSCKHCHAASNNVSTNMADEAVEKNLGMGFAICFLVFGRIISSQTTYLNAGQKKILRGMNTLKLKMAVQQLNL